MIKHLTYRKKWLQWYFLQALPSALRRTGCLLPNQTDRVSRSLRCRGGTDLVARAFADAAKNHLPVASGLSINLAEAVLSA